MLLGLKLEQVKHAPDFSDLGLTKQVLNVGEQFKMFLRVREEITIVLSLNYSLSLTKKQFYIFESSISYPGFDFFSISLKDQDCYSFHLSVL